MLLVRAHKSTYTLYNTLTEYQSEPVLVRKAFHYSFHYPLSHKPQHYQVLGSPLVGDVRKKNYGTMKEKQRQGLGGKGKKKSSVRRLNMTLNIFPELSHSMPAIFREN